MLALEIPDLGLLPSQHYLQTTHEGHGYRSPYTAICHLSMLFNESLNNLASWTEGSQTEGRTDGRMDRFLLCSTGLRPLLLNLDHRQLKQGTDTADHLLPLGCY